MSRQRNNTKPWNKSLDDEDVLLDHVYLDTDVEKKPVCAKLRTKNIMSYYHVLKEKLPESQMTSYDVEPEIIMIETKEKNFGKAVISLHMDRGTITVQGGKANNLEKKADQLLLWAKIAIKKSETVPTDVTSDVGDVECNLRETPEKYVEALSVPNQMLSENEDDQIDPSISQLSLYRDAVGPEENRAEDKKTSENTENIIHRDQNKSRDGNMTPESQTNNQGEPPSRSINEYLREIEMLQELVEDTRQTNQESAAIMRLERWRGTLGKNYQGKRRATKED